MDKFLNINVSRRLTSLVADWINARQGVKIASSTNTYRIQFSINDIRMKIDVATIFPFVARGPLSVADLQAAADKEQRRSKVHHMETVRRVLRFTRPSTQMANLSSGERLARAKIHAFCHVALATHFGERFVQPVNGLVLHTQIIGLNAGLRGLEGWCKIDPSLAPYQTSMGVELKNLRKVRSLEKTAAKLSFRARLLQEETFKRNGNQVVLF